MVGKVPQYSLETKLKILDEYHEMMKKPKEEREKIEEFCARHGISSGVLYKWLRREKQFRNDLEELMKLARERVEEEKENEETEEEIEKVAEKIEEEAEELVKGEELVKEMIDDIQGAPVEEENKEEAVGDTPQATEVRRSERNPSVLLIWTAVGGLLFVLIGGIILILRDRPKAPKVDKVEMKVEKPAKEEPPKAETVPAYEVVGQTDGLPVISPD